MQYLLRRKIKFTILALLVLPLTTFSQLREVVNMPDYDDKLYHFGINMGVNKSHFNFTHHPYFLNQDSVMDVESINSTGINLAWLVNLKLSDHFAIRTFPIDLIFSEKAFEYSLKYPDPSLGETPITVKKVQSITLSLPVQLKFTSDRIGNLRVYTVAGGKFDYDLAATAGARNGEDLLTLKKYDYGLEGGIGFHFYFEYFVLSPELKASWGLSNLHDRNPNLKFSNVIDKIKSRMISFSLTVE